MNLLFLFLLYPSCSSCIDLQRQLIREEFSANPQAPCYGSGGSAVVCAENSGCALSLRGANQPTVQHPGCRPECFAGVAFDSASQSAYEYRSL